MQRNRLQSVTLAIALSLFTTSAHAWPLGRLLHLHPDVASDKDGRVSFVLYNKSDTTQAFDLAGRKYTLRPNSGLTVTASEGTRVIAETVSPSHSKGDVLFAVQPTLRNDTVIVR